MDRSNLHNFMSEVGIDLQTSVQQLILAAVFKQDMLGTFYCLPAIGFFDQNEISFQFSSKESIKMAPALLIGYFSFGHSPDENHKYILAYLERKLGQSEDRSAVNTWTNYWGDQELSLEITTFRPDKNDFSRNAYLHAHPEKIIATCIKITNHLPVKLSSVVRKEELELVNKISLTDNITFCGPKRIGDKQFFLKNDLIKPAPSREIEIWRAPDNYLGLIIGDSAVTFQRAAECSLILSKTSAGRGSAASDLYFSCSNSSDCLLFSAPGEDTLTSLAAALAKAWEVELKVDQYVSG